MVSRWAGGRRKKVCPGCISEIVRCSKFDLDLIFDLAIVTFAYKILSGLYLANCKVYKVDTWYGHWLGVVGVQYHGVSLI